MGLGEMVKRLGRGVSDCLYRSGQLTEGVLDGNQAVPCHLSSRILVRKPILRDFLVEGFKPFNQQAVHNNSSLGHLF